MDSKRYINVILPLKLGWEPFYSLPSDSEDAQVGDRVLVRFAGRSYLGVVSDVGKIPPAGMKVQEAFGLAPHKDKVSRDEIRYWRALAEYYMCCVGEVYKVAYPSVKDESVRTRKKESAFVAPMDSVCSLPFEFSLSAGKPMLLRSASSLEYMLEMCRRSIAEGRNVLWLVPEVKLSKYLQERVREALGTALVVWGSNITPAKKREVVRWVRGEETVASVEATASAADLNSVRSGAYVVLGTRSSLLLPHHDLGLVLVQEEHEASYKQTSPAPRYNGRDAAVILAGIHGARVVLESKTPSFESILNALSGKYEMFSEGNSFCEMTDLRIVDTRAELFKNGMRGDMSFKMLEAARNPELKTRGLVPAFYKPRRAAFPKLEELTVQLQAECGADVFVTDDLIENPLPESVGMLGFFGSDALLGRQDFRADERLIQTVMQSVEQSKANTVVIHTRDASHPVFKALASGDVSALLSERREFGYPPFTRIVDIVVRDDFEERSARMISALASHLYASGFASVGLPASGSGAGSGSVSVIPMPGYGIRVILPRDRMLQTRKQTLRSLVDSFEKSSKYPSHIHFDVDPQ